MKDEAWPKSEKMTPVILRIAATAVTLTVGKRSRLAASSHLDDLAENRQRDLRRRFGRNIETDGSIHAFDHFLGDLLFVAERLQTGLDGPPAADHADILRLAVDNFAQARLIVLLSTRPEHDLSVQSDRHLLTHLRN